MDAVFKYTCVNSIVIHLIMQSSAPAKVSAADTQLVSSVNRASGQQQQPKG
jgi:hypothetical protein